jgi:hypothetical protein
MGLPKTLTRLGNICIVLTFVSLAGLMVNAYLYGANRYESFGEIINAPFFQKGFWWILFGVSITGSGLFHVAGVMAGKRLFNQIARDGQESDAKVLALNDTGTRINNDPLVNISLEVQPPNLLSFKTEVKQTVSILFLPYLQPGKFVRVKYIPGTEKVAIVGTN